MTRVELYRYEATAGKLPRICLVCGEPASCWVQKKLQVVPDWGYLVRLFCVTVLKDFPGGNPVESVDDNGISLQTPLCDTHRRYWFRRDILQWAALFAVAALTVAAAIGNMSAKLVSDKQMYWGIAAAIMLWICLAIGLRQASIRIVRITRVRVTLDGVSSEFADSIAERRLEKDAQPAPSFPDLSNNPFAQLNE